MLEISRTVKFCLNGDGSLADHVPVDNSFAAWPPMRGFGRYYELDVTCRGEADAVTGYFMNIKRIDHATRAAALHIIATAARMSDGDVGMGSVMRDVLESLHARLDHAVIAVTLRLTPTYTLTIEEADMSNVLLSQQYEFAAAHRLHAPQLSEQQNVEVFGKCNNPAGHGHNYRVEVTVRCPVDAEGAIADVERLDALVNATVIEQLDHKNLDIDVPQFAALNSSVENIAKVIYEMLHDAADAAGMPLDQVRVWETAKTACTYRG
ncbi:MAG: hypothetical protein GC159_05585 [Phycisphaera sp.]|nr:hypothetical protein [Phycisphaera sp.]